MTSERKRNQASSPINEALGVIISLLILYAAFGLLLWAFAVPR